ncbi:MAG: type II toxin-antitoxin system RelE/ParE family toxin [Candidatus Desantisbacteria bacterium]
MVKWTIPAKEDLKQIHDYIARDSKFYAKKVSEEIVERSKELKDFPKMGRIVPETGTPDIRELFIYSYRLIYELIPNGVQILTVIHGKRDFLHGNSAISC